MKRILCVKKPTKGNFIIQPKKTPTSKRSLGGAMNSLIISFLVLIRIIEISFSINSDFSYFYVL